MNNMRETNVPLGKKTRAAKKVGANPAVKRQTAEKVTMVTITAREVVPDSAEDTSSEESSETGDGQAEYRET